MIGNWLFGFTIGLLVALAWCYWKQINAIYEKKDLIGSGADFVSSGQAFWGELKKL